MAAGLQIATAVIMVLLAVFLVVMILMSARIMVLGLVLLAFFALFLFVAAPITWLLTKSFNVKKQKNSKRLRLAAAAYLAVVLTVAVITVASCN